MVNANPIPPLTARQIEKFWARVDASGDCWEWTGGVGQGPTDLYGRFSMGSLGVRPAHRVVWQILVGPLTTDVEVDHLCFNKVCVNPDHLEPVTQEENLRRRRAMAMWPTYANSIRTHCPKGHPYDEENTYRDPKMRYRRCKECHRQQVKKAPRRQPGTIPCSVEQCDQFALTRGLCESHYQKAWRARKKERLTG